MRNRPSIASARSIIGAALTVATLTGSCFADTLLLTSGEKLVGKILSEDPTKIVIESAALGKIEVPRDRVQRLEKEQEAVQAAAPVPGGQEAPTSAAEPGASAVETTQPEKEDYFFRLYWDEGLRYQLSEPISVPVPFTEGRRTIGEEVNVSGRLGLRLSLDAAAFSSTGGEPPLPSDFDVRTFRLYTSGEFGLSRRWLYAVQLGSVSGSFDLHEAYLRRPGVEYLGNVTFGYFKVPQTLDHIAPFGSMTFMEAPSPSLAFAPGNRMGVQIDRTFHDERVNVALGIYSLGADPGLDFGDATQSLVRPTFRVTGLPIVDEHGKYGRRLLHLGVSASYVLAGESEIHYRARPESFLAPYLADTGQIKATYAVVTGLEALYIDGPLTLQSEFVSSKVDGDLDRYYFNGYYLSGSWFLTGEERPYDKAAASFGHIKPRADFSWKNKKWGAWEVGLRYSRLNLNSGAIRGGNMGVATLGLNWYWSRYVRWQLNYEHAKVDEGPSPGTLHIFQGRLQLTY